VTFKGGISNFKLKGNEQLEAFLWVVVPEFGVTKSSSMLDESHVLVIPLVGDRNTPTKGIQADLLLLLEGVVTLVGIGERGRDILRQLISSLKALLGDPGFAMLSVFLALCPESLVGGSNLPLDATS
jgi:hypothetical protein